MPVTLGAVSVVVTPSGLLMSLDAGHTLPPPRYLSPSHTASVAQHYHLRDRVASQLRGWESSGAHGGFDAVPLPSWSLAFFVTDKGLRRPEEERKSFTLQPRTLRPGECSILEVRCAQVTGLISLKCCVSCWAPPRSDASPLDRAEPEKPCVYLSCRPGRVTARV